MTRVATSTPAHRTHGAMLEARQVVKCYPGGVQALAGVTLKVGRGETVALIGESGAGKTTLLRAFNRTIEPSAGEIRVAGEPIDSQDPIALRRQMGYVPQNGGLMPHWRVARNTELVPTLLGWDAQRREARGREMLQLVGLDPELFARRYPSQLSGGERQRVAIARALAADPEVILLDEPFGALDAITRHELQEEFSTLKQRLGKTTLLVTHDLDEAFRLADRVAVMWRGRILQEGTSAELRRHPADSYVSRLLARGGQRD